MALFALAFLHAMSGISLNFKMMFLRVSSHGGRPTVFHATYPHANRLSAVRGTDLLACDTTGVLETPTTASLLCKRSHPRDPARALLRRRSPTQPHLTSTSGPLATIRPLIPTIGAGMVPSARVVGMWRGTCAGQVDSFSLALVPRFAAVPGSCSALRTNLPATRVLWQPGWSPEQRSRSPSP